MWKNLKIALCVIAIIILAMLGRKSSDLRKKLAKQKSETAKLKHGLKVNKTKDAVSSVNAQIGILKKDETKNNIAITVLEKDVIELEKKIEKSAKKIKEADPEITDIAAAFAYAEKLKNEK